LVRPQVIDFDVLGVNEIRTRTINLTNANPVKVAINWMETDVGGLVIKLDSVWNSHGYATSGRLLEANKQKLAAENKKYDFNSFFKKRIQILFINTVFSMFINIIYSLIFFNFVVTTRLSLCWSPGTAPSSPSSCPVRCTLAPFFSFLFLSFII
jgi:hypothetical protein